jgi:hypothetical protein
MHAALSSLVASSLLMHAVLGCCWHHRQANTCCDDSHVAQASEVGCHHHHDDCGDDDHEQSVPTPCNGGPHCNGVCIYLPVQKTQIDQVQFVAPLDFAAFNLPPGVVHVAAAHSLERLYELDTGPPLRLHLAYQILLI